MKNCIKLGLIDVYLLVSYLIATLQKVYITYLEMEVSKYVIHISIDAST